MNYSSIAFNTAFNTAFNDNNPYARPCVCSEEEPVDTPRSFCYVEGTQLDKSTSDNIEELGENVWFESKPPRLFRNDLKPLVTARQVQISRVLLSGGRTRLLGVDDNPCMVQKVMVKMNKKRSDKRFLSSTRVDEE